MPNVLVRDVPDEVHAALLRRAERSGRSLQQLLLAELTRIAERPTIEEVLDRVERRRGGRAGLTRVAELIAEDRERR